MTGTQGGFLLKEWVFIHVLKHLTFYQCVSCSVKANAYNRGIVVWGEGEEAGLLNNMAENALMHKMESFSLKMFNCGCCSALLAIQVYSGLCAAAASSSWGLGPVHRLAFLLKSLKKPLRSRPLLTRQQSDKLPKNGSYRKLPEECSTATCSGRDALSWQVLNDRYCKVGLNKRSDRS